MCLSWRRSPPGGERQRGAGHVQPSARRRGRALSGREGSAPPCCTADLPSRVRTVGLSAAGGVASRPRLPCVKHPGVRTGGPRTSVQSARRVRHRRRRRRAQSRPSRRRGANPASIVPGIPASAAPTINPTGGDKNVAAPNSHPSIRPRTSSDPNPEPDERPGRHRGALVSASTRRGPRPLTLRGGVCHRP